jgi:drug/metabolite transporter (DMT)-like permease
MAIIPISGTLAATVALCSLGYFFITGSVRVGDVSVAIPCRYTGLMFYLAAGMLVFGEQRDAIVFFWYCCNSFVQSSHLGQKNHYKG